MRTLVTGGAGFIGTNLVASLLQRGHDVVVVDNRRSASPLPDHPGARYIDADVVDPLVIDGRFDVIYHFASVASPPRYLADPVGTLRTNAEGTRLLLDRAEQDGSTFVYASTSEIYGDPLEHPQREEYFGNVDITSPRSCYDEAKRYGETLTHTYRRTGRVPETRVARIFNTYGPGMHPEDGRVVTNFVMQALRGEPLSIFGDGSQTRSFCYIDDLTAGILALADSDVVEPVNLGNPTEFTINELADVVETKLGPVGRIERELPQSDPAQRQPDITRARELLGWEPATPLSEGLDRTIEYLRAFVS